MPVGFEIDKIEFSDTSLTKRPRHAEILARIFTGFAIIEGSVGGIYGLLKHSDYTTALDELSEMGTNIKRTQAVRNLVSLELPAADAAPIEALMIRVLNYAEKRNKIAHGIWGVHPDEANVVYRIPVKRWIVFLASLLPRKADPSDIITELNEHVETYTVADLEQLERDGAALLKDVVLAFTGLAKKTGEA